MFFDERGKMQVLDKKQKKLVTVSPGEFADLLETTMLRVEGGDVGAWMDLMGLFITGFIGIIQALRVTEAMTEVDTDTPS